MHERAIEEVSGSVTHQSTAILLHKAPRSAESSEELSQSSPPMEEFTGVSIQVTEPQ